MMTDTDVKPPSKWKDPDFRRVYRRDLARKNNGKRHPNILEDGTKWSERYPYGEYDSLEEKRKAMRERYYKPAEKVTCTICNVSIFKSRREKHEECKKHLDNLALVQKYLGDSLPPSLFRDHSIINVS